MTPQDVDIDSYRMSCQIRKPERLIKTGIALTVVILLMFLTPVRNMDAAWVAMLGALMILLVCSHMQVAALIERVEWDTLFYLAGVFVLMEVCSQLRLIRVIAIAFKSAIEGPGMQHRDLGGKLAAGCSLFFWLSAVLSMFMDNAALALFLIRVVTTMTECGLDVPIKPLAYAISFGTTLGGNTTIFGSASNGLAATLAASKGFKIPIRRFTEISGPVAITSLLSAYVYILIAYSGSRYYNV